MYPRPVQSTSITNRVAYRVVLIISLVVWLLPLAAILLTSVRSLADINSGNYWGRPSEISLLKNYSEVFLRSSMLRYFLNSVIVTVPAVIIAVSISSMAGYSLAMHRFRGRFALFATFIAGNFIPFQVLMIPVRQLTIQLGIFNTPFALIAFHVAFQSGFCTFFLRNFTIELPYSLVESARIDGAGEWRIYFSIIMPLLRPALSALAVLIFTFIWNDFFWALILIQSDEARTVTVGLQALRGQWIASWHLIAAGSMVAALPPVIMFFGMQRHFIRGLTFGAVKG